MNDHMYETAFKLLPTPILLVSVGAVCTVSAINPACGQLLELSEKEVKGKEFVNIFFSAANDHQSALQECQKKVCNDKMQHEIKELKYVPGNKLPGTADKYLRVLFTPVLNDEGDLLQIIVTLIDITDIVVARRTETSIREALSSNQKFLNETQRVARSGSWEADLITNKMTWSEVMREIHEVEPDYEPTFASSLGFYSTDEQRTALTNLVQDAIAANKVFDIELEIITAKGNIRVLQCSGKADLAEGMPARVYGTAQDITERKKVETALLESHNRYQDLVLAVDGVVWEADATTFNFTFVSEQASSILGYTPAQWLSEPNFWVNHIHKDDRESAVSFCQLQTQKARSHTFDYRMIKANGEIVWIKDIVSVITENGLPKLLRGIMVDITETKLLAELDHLEKEVLELNSKQVATLEDVLNTYVRGIEGLFADMKFSILRLVSNKLYNWSSPSLPAAYLAAVEGLEIGPEVGTCGTSAFLKQTVIVSDIATDPKWSAYKHLILPHNLCACWSYPISDVNGNVLAVLGVYYNTAKSPEEDEIAIIERTAAILKVILENKLYEATIREVNMLVTQGQELANFGNWQWDIRANKVTWSDVLYTIYGQDDKTFQATFEGYLSMLHPDDIDRVKNLIYNVVETGEDIMFEERIIRPDGEIRHLKSWGRVIPDESGKPSKMIGACLDITKAKESETKMKEIAWIQSHVIRAPLANLIGLVNMLDDMSADAEQQELLRHILHTSHELDNIIRNISSKTKY